MRSDIFAHSDRFKIKYDHIINFINKNSTFHERYTVISFSTDHLLLGSAFSNRSGHQTLIAIHKTIPIEERFNSSLHQLSEKRGP